MTAAARLGRDAGAGLICRPEHLEFQRRTVRLAGRAAPRATVRFSARPRVEIARPWLSVEGLEPVARVKIGEALHPVDVGVWVLGTIHRASMLSHVPGRDLRTMLWREACAQMPRHDPATEPLPAWVEDWHDAFDSGADIGTYRGARL